MPPRSSFCNWLGISRLIRFGSRQLPAILLTAFGLALSFSGSLDCRYFIISARLQVFNEEGELLSDGRTLGGGLWTVQDGESCIEWPEDVDFDAWMYVGKTMSAISCILAALVTLLMLWTLVSDQPRTRYMKRVACTMMILTNVESSVMFVLLTKMCKDPYTCKVGRSGFVSIAASGVWFFTALLTSTLKFQADTLYKAPEGEDTCKNNKRVSPRSTVSHLPNYLDEDEEGRSVDMSVCNDEESERSARSRDVEMPPHKPLSLPDRNRPSLDRATSARSTESTIMTGDGSMSLASAHIARSRTASGDLSVASAHSLGGRASSVPRTYSNSSTTHSVQRPVPCHHSTNSNEILPGSSLSNAKMPERYVNRAHSMNSNESSVASTRPGRTLAPAHQLDRPRSVARTRTALGDLSLSSTNSPRGSSVPPSAYSLNSLKHSSRQPVPRNHSRNSNEVSLASSLSNARMPERYVNRAQSVNSTEGAVASSRPGRTLAPVHQHDRPRSVSRTRQPQTIARTKSIDQRASPPAPDNRAQLTRSRSWDNSSSNLVYHHHHHHHPVTAGISRSMHENPTDRVGMPPSLVRTGGRRPNASLERITAAHNARIARSGGVTRTDSGISIDTIESFEI